MDTQHTGLFPFKPSALLETQTGEPTLSAWKVLSVEDDITYQQTLSVELSGINILGQPIELFTANSAGQAATLLLDHPDMAVILLDVVMENDDAGLRLIGNIRNAIGNATVRIVLLTGQPGMAPRKDVMEQYDINEYWNKADLTQEKLRAVLTGNIRSWQAFQSLEKSKAGLQVLIQAAQAIAPKTDLREFTTSLLDEIGKLTHANAGGIVCASVSPEQLKEQLTILAASGQFEPYIGSSLHDVLNETHIHIPLLQSYITAAIAQADHVFSPWVSVLYFDTSEINGSTYVMIVNSNAHLSDYHLQLLRAFCENINDGFKKIGLIKQLSDLAYQDAELHIPNRNWLIRNLNSLTNTEKEQSSLLLIRLRDFNDIEMSIGHINSMSLLIQYCRVLQRTLPGSRSIARLTYDTLVLIFDKTPTFYDVEYQQATELNTHLGDTTWTLHSNIVLLPLGDYCDDPADIILSLGKAALNLAQENAKPFYQVNAELKSTILNRQSLIFDLSAALSRDEFYIVLQPKVRLSNRAVVGFEALLRWQKPDGTLVPPDTFIPLAESTGLIRKIDAIALDLTLQAVQTLLANGYRLRVSFNATGADLLDSTYIDKLLNLSQLNQVPSEFLDIEITETMAMEHYERINPILRLLINLGYHVSIDDFGTGYSSLSHITRLAATHLKIDRSFVDAMTTHQEGEQITDVIMQLGKRFNFSVIAEGIETEQQHQMLLAKDCEYGQGYYFAKPMTLADVLVWLETQSVESSGSTSSPRTLS